MGGGESYSDVIIRVAMCPIRPTDAASVRAGSLLSALVYWPDVGQKRIRRCAVARKYLKKLALPREAHKPDKIRPL